MMKTGIGTASRWIGDLVVGGIVAVNCFGDIVDPSTGTVVAGALTEPGDAFAGAMNLLASMGKWSAECSTNTSIGAVATNARLDKGQARRVAIMAQDGLARTIVPAHTPMDGDTVFCLSTGEVEADVSLVGALAAEVVAQSVLNAVRMAESAYGVAGYREVHERIRRVGPADGQPGASKGARRS